MGFIIKKFEAHSLICNGAESSCNHEVNVSLSQLTVQRLRCCGHEMNHDARKAPGESIDDCGHKVRRQKWIASDSHFSGGGIGEILDALHRLAQVIEDGGSSIEQGA